MEDVGFGGVDGGGLGKGGDGEAEGEGDGEGVEEGGVRGDVDGGGLVGADVPAFGVVDFGERWCGEEARLHVWGVLPAKRRKVGVDGLEAGNGGDVGWHAKSAEECIGAIELGVEVCVSRVGVAEGVHVAAGRRDKFALCAHANCGCAEVVTRLDTGGCWDHESDAGV